MNTYNAANMATHLVLQIMALHFNRFGKFRKYLRSDDGWIDFTAGLSTETGSVGQAIAFSGGKAKVLWGVPANADVELRFKDNEVLAEMTKLPPNEVMNLLLKNRLTIRGNLAYGQLFSFFISLLMKGKQINMMQKQVKAQMKDIHSSAPSSGAVAPPSRADGTPP
jgi:formate C-acetyltransferase